MAAAQNRSAMNEHGANGNPAFVAPTLSFCDRGLEKRISHHRMVRLFLIIGLSAARRIIDSR